MENVKRLKTKNGSLLAVLVLFIFGFAILITILAIVVPANAETSVQLTDQNVIAGQTFMVYCIQPTGLVFIGEYNTTSLVSLENDMQYVFVLKPSTIDYIHNPLALFDLFTNSVPGWLLVFSALAICGIGFVIIRMARGK